MTDDPAQVGSARRIRPVGRLARRILFFGLGVATTAYASLAMLDILGANGLERIELAILLLFVFNFFWLALSFWSAFMGFVFEALGIEPITLRRRSRLHPPTSAPLRTRTAIVMAERNEPPDRIFAAFEALLRDLAPTGHLDHFDFFVLSGTDDPAQVEIERRVWAATADRIGVSGRLFFWKREERTGRKAGTISDFLRRWGSQYDHMVVFDADSLMTASVVVELVRLMEANPGAGLIQTLPMPINQSTLFGRVLQFASWVYARVFATGTAWWQLGEANYYGHNAILRPEAFRTCCGLPTLSGSPPLGGEIHSHDFVESALLRRGGWQVYFLPHLGGSYEELPSNLLDFAVRDRRWAQGNLQHLKLLRAKGLHPISRFHFLSGAFAFILSPLWLLFLVLSTAQMVVEAVVGHEYFPPGYSLFPEWPISKMSETISLATATVALLFVPKLLGVLLALVRERRAFGGVLRLLASTLLEILFSILMAPIMMALHSYFVLTLMVGRVTGWDPQHRSERGLGLREAFSSLGVLFFAAIGWGVLLLVAAPDRVWWVLPVLTGLVFAVPVTVWSSRGTVGARLRAAGILLTPEEIRPDPAIGVAHAAQQANAAVLAAEPAAVYAEPSGPPPTRMLPMPPAPLDHWPPATTTESQAPAGGAPG
ncbi:MAG: glucans biosynthesis glucosyltransferase MdoH [Deltaproteobacteria bacterium]|nr:glucans biosynthesis glucosyltransferase MdoH [Deltaproteobacteria bacterium]